MPETAEIESLVIDSVRMLAEDFEIDVLSDPKPESLLYGEGGPLDSMALVNLIADVEDAVSAKFRASITLADARAMSAKHSPFRTIASLTQAISERLPS